MLRARRLAESINRFNTDKIPFYISVPQSDIDKFRECFMGIKDANFVTDEKILKLTGDVYGAIPSFFPRYLIQQLVKMEFWRFNPCENYVWIDSDSYFIKNFTTSDFFSSNGITPYTIMHLSTDLFDFANKFGKKRIVDDFNKMSRKFKKIFNRKGPSYDFGPSPLIWSSKVLKSLHKEYLNKKNITIYNLLHAYPCEMQLYGEYMLHSHIIPVCQREPLFKVYHYAEQYFESQMKGEYEYSLSKKYLGIVIQSYWTNLKQTKKNSLSRFKKNLKKLLNKFGLYLIFNQ